MSFNCLSIQWYLALHTMKDIFLLNTSSNHNISNEPIFYSRPVNSVYSRTESISHFLTKRWELPNNIKALESLHEFENTIKLWNLVRYLYRTDIPLVAFVK